MSPLGGAIASAENPLYGVSFGQEAAWYVVQTQRHRERVAQRFLSECTIATYLPLIEQWPRPVVGNAIAPMFPGYLFVRTVLADQFHHIVWTLGVKEFVRFGGEPAALDESVVEFLRSREGPNGLILFDQHVRDKSEIRIVHGPFRGLTAVVEERLPARERICVLMDLLQRRTRVELPERWVRQA